MKPPLSISERTYRTCEDRQIKDAMILDNLEFVRSILFKTIAELPERIDRQNLESAGVLGLVEAAENFDSTRGVEFKTFAYRRIRGAILDELRRNSPLPQRMLQLITRINEACEQLDDPVTPEQIAAHCGLELEEVDTALEAMRLRRMQTWEDPQQWLASLTDSRNVDPQQIATDRDLLQCMTAAIEELPENERLVITLYYLEDLRLREIGELLNLSESRISRLVSKAEFRLAQLVRSQVDR